MVKKVLEDEYVMLFINRHILMINPQNIIMKIKNPHILDIGVQIIYTDGQCQLPVAGFKCVRNTSPFNKDFIKTDNKNNGKRYVLKSIFNIPKITILYNDFLFLPKRKKIKKTEKLVSSLHDEEEYVKHKKSISSIKIMG